MSRKKKAPARRARATRPSGSRAAPPARRLLWAWLAPLLALGVAAGAAALRRANRPAGAPPPPAAVAPQPLKAPPFDSQRAFDLLKKQLAFGPRVPGRPGHAACRDFLLAELKKYADDAALQQFTPRVRGQAVPMANLIARWKPKEKGGVLLAAHWDTRPTADQEADPARRRQPIPGANDGASGVAVLLELARQFHATAPPVPVTIVLFDGEDYGPGIEDMFYGSRYYADHLPPDGPARGILLDMIGDRDLSIPQEQYSSQRAGQVQREVYEIAARLNYARQFPAVEGLAIQDDHLPLQAKGLQVIDLIDFDYPHWHTLGDTAERCSPRSLQAVGEVVGAWVYGQK
jgi:hypothetical protein